MKHILTIFLVLACILFVFPKDGLAELGEMFPNEGAGAQERIVEIKKIKREINQTEMFLELDDFAFRVLQTECGTYRKQANEAAAKARTLNEEFKDNPTEQYQKDVKHQKDANKAYMESYKSCFQEVLRRNPTEKIAEENIRSFDGFEKRYKELTQYLGKNGNHDAAQHYLADLKRKLEELYKDRVTIGVLVSVFRNVQVQRENKWINAQQGMFIYLSDHIRTGDKGRARLEMKDRVEDGNRGPTVINIGSQSLIHMQKFETSFTDQPPHRTGIIDLIRGTIRAKTKNWGARSLFAVRTGTSLCGIRGTDVIIKYDEEKNEASYLLDHGKVEITPQKGDRFILKDKQMVQIKNGRAEDVKDMPDDIWQSAVSASTLDENIKHEDKNKKTNANPNKADPMHAFDWTKSESELEVTYEGCYKDKSFLFTLWRRDLDKEMLKRTALGSCISYCAAMNYQYAAAQSGHYCFCDNDFGKYGMVDESACNMPCDDDAQLICGGKSANSVYRIVQ